MECLQEVLRRTKGLPLRFVDMDEEVYGPVRVAVPSLPAPEGIEIPDVDDVRDDPISAGRRPQISQGGAPPTRVETTVGGINGASASGISSVPVKAEDVEDEIVPAGLPSTFSAEINRPRIFFTKL